MTNTRSFLQIWQLWQGEAIHTVEGLVQPEFEKDKKYFISGI